MRIYSETADFRLVPKVHRNAPSLALLLVWFADLLTLWCHRAKTREGLGRVERELLADLGLSEQEAEREAQKWFWQE